MEKQPARKNIRLPEYDYSTNGAYFITICTQDKKHLLGEITQTPVGATLCGRPSQMIDFWLHQIESKYPLVTLDKYVVMPNHIHAVLLLTNPAGDHTGSPLPTIVDWFKTMTTNAYIRGVKAGIYEPFRKHFWQRSYYDHVIRNEAEYLRVWEYIDNNPAEWAEDEYYCEVTVC